MERIVAIVNPASGNYSKSLEDMTSRTLFSRDFDFELFYTTRIFCDNSHRNVYTNLERIVIDEARNGTRDFIFSGGDGTIGDGINGVISSFLNSSNFILSVIPAGSGNDFASGGLGIESLEDSSDVFKRYYINRENNVKAVDIFEVRVEEAGFFRYGINSADASFGSFLLNFMEKKWTGRTTKKMFGKNSYSLLAPYVSLFYRSGNIGIKVNGQTRVESSRKNFLANLQNSELAGGGLRLCPGAKIDDGYFDLLVYDRKSRVHFPISLMLEAKEGKVEKYSGASHLRGIEEVEIYSNKGNLGRNLTIDGELYTFEKPFSKVVFRKTGKKIKFLVNV